MSNDLTAEQLRKLLHYNPATGVFTWRTSGFGMKRGNVAGKEWNYAKSNLFYWRIGIIKKRYYAHRLAWLYVYGVWPSYEIDHIDGNGLNNCINNLREAKRHENMQNVIFKTNKSGYIGVSWSKIAKKWQAQISNKLKRHHLGYYDTPEAAHAAYLAAKADLHTFQPVPREQVAA